MKNEEKSVQPAKVRKPYSPPQLTRLGSVRELTLGGGVTLPDIGSMHMMAPGM